MYIVNVISPKNEIYEHQKCQKCLLELLKAHESTKLHVGILGSNLQGNCQTCSDKRKNTKHFTWNP